MAAFQASLGVLFFLSLSPAKAQAPARLRPWEMPALPPQPRPIIIDPGHGGEDLGAVAGGLEEKDIALAVALKLREHLAALGLGPVLLTREVDEFVSLDGRVREASDWNGAVFISLHANKVFWKRLHGITVYAYGKGHGRSDRRHRKHRKVPPLAAPGPQQVQAGADLAARLARSLLSEGWNMAPPERADYYVLKNPRAASVLIEMGYLSNPREAKLLAQAAYQDRLAAALARGLADQLDSHAARLLPNLQASAALSKR